MSRVVGILAYPLGEDFGLAARKPRTPGRAYRRALLEKANPRPPRYMQELFAERYPEGELADDVPGGGVAQLVLLYPDAIGLGFGAIERRLPPGVPVRVLNGRRREFPLDARARVALRIRRVLERSMLVEALALTVGAALTPFLLVADLARGRR